MPEVDYLIKYIFLHRELRNQQEHELLIPKINFAGSTLQRHRLPPEKKAKITNDLPGKVLSIQKTLAMLPFPEKHIPSFQLSITVTKMAY